MVIVEGTVTQAYMSGMYNESTVVPKAGVARFISPQRLSNSRRAV